MIIFYTLITLHCFVYNDVNAIYLTNVSKANAIENNPAIWTESGEIWGPLLEEWALNGNHREKRVMKLPPNNAYIITEKDAMTPEQLQEGKIAPGKIVNNNNHNKPPVKQVTETDLYLLGAIEKLVYRMDFMEKRLRKVEEMLYYVMAGNRMDQEPCPENFTRAGVSCYFFSNMAGREVDWKMASKYCKKHNSILAEMESIEENQDLIAYIQTNHFLRGKDFWIGGLNPGLLWIWSNSARPVKIPGKENNNATIYGAGRCLRLKYDPSLRSYSYFGTECSLRYGFICKTTENITDNQISRLSKKLLESP